MDADPQGDRDLRRRPAARAGRARRRAQAARAASRTATAPTASARSASCSRSPTSQAAHQGAVPPAHLDRLAVRARADDLDHDRGRAPSRSSRSATRSTSSARKTGLYGLDVSIGPLYLFAFGAVAFYGIMLGGWASGSKYSFLGAMRAAAQLISYEVAPGPRARRRGHDRADAVAHRDRRGPGGHVVRHPAVRRLPHLPDRRRSPRPTARRSTSSRPTPSSSAATSTEYGGGALRLATTSPSTSTCSSSRAS